MKDVTMEGNAVVVKAFLLAVQLAYWDCTLVEYWVGVLVCNWADLTVNLSGCLVVV